MFEYLNSSALDVIIFLTIVTILGDIAIKKKAYHGFFTSLSNFTVNCIVPK